jgi:hypothetical protein
VATGAPRRATLRDTPSALSPPIRAATGQDDGARWLAGPVLVAERGATAAWPGARRPLRAVGAAATAPVGPAVRRTMTPWPSRRWTSTPSA